MKILITESKLERVAINWLNDNYGDLEPYETEKYPNQVFYRKGKEIIFSYNKKNGMFFVNYQEVWSFFKSFLGLENEQIRELTKIWVEEHYNLRVTTTICDFISRDFTMEEHYNLRVTTTMSTLTKPLPTLDYKLI
jgi:hypothetical protein